ncbi:MAG: polyprenyl synthetase family protein, partial [Myxococcota bacterium]|nr:polyprenyl synthetase family protein [Myxococcota bacterium]
IADGAAPRTRSAIEYLRRQGGKRLRPLVVLASTRACGGDPEWSVREAALVEWLHQTSLVIDDVLDGATLRRGGPTLHHATSVPFATGVALQLLSRLASSARDLPESGRVLFAEAAATLADGEWSEMRHTGDPTLSLTEYHRIVEAKTARLFSAAAALGGLAAGAPPAHVRALSRSGREAGLAFQIVDDLLDLVGDERDLGKRPGTDLRARKCTLPILLLRDASDAAERVHLEALVRGERAVDDAEIARLCARVRDLGIDARCRERAQSHLARALAELERLPDREGARVLAELFGRCVERDR